MCLINYRVIIDTFLDLGKMGHAHNLLDEIGLHILLHEMDGICTNAATDSHQCGESCFAEEQLLNRKSFIQTVHSC